MSDAYTEVRAYVQRLVGTAGGPAPAAGSQEWCALADGDRAKMLAVLHAGTRAVLEDCVAAIDDRRRKSKAAAVEVSQADDWTAVARRVRDRDQALKSGSYIERVSV
ncbi:DUF2742 domain-containing protein [Gordonia hongkongensis]|uniref:DUF2742 domain-containing protein n=1 Tax=Gordonia hongkongensis TaxID=1701090 RepID=UPI0030D1FD75